MLTNVEVYDHRLESVQLEDGKPRMDGKLEGSLQYRGCDDDNINPASDGFLVMGFHTHDGPLRVDPSSDAEK